MSMKKHVTLVCDGPDCKAEVHTGHEKNDDARNYATNAYGWSTLPSWAPGSGGGGKRWDLCPTCSTTVKRPGT